MHALAMVALSACLLASAGCEVQVHRHRSRDGAAADSSVTVAAARCTCDPPCKPYQTCVNGTCYDRAGG